MSDYQVLTPDDIFPYVNFTVTAKDGMVAFNMRLNTIAGMHKLMEPVQARAIGMRLINQADLADRQRDIDGGYDE